ncbi:MAG: PstS family phosphate ABC transporter substrate-binding protein [Thermodesulfobacteriota bacterium]
MRSVIGLGLLCAAIICGTVGLAEGTPPETEKPKIVIMGATTVAALIGQAVAEYQKTHPDVVLVVHGNTHGQGFRALLDRTADVAMLARALSDSERREAGEKGINLVEGSLGNDAIAIVVNPLNPVSELSLEQFRGIFGGTITNWKQVGGADEPIEVVTMPPDSAMRSFLTGSVTGGEITESAVQVRTIRQTIKLTESRKGAITYCRSQLVVDGGPKEANLKPLALRVTQDSPAIPLTEKTVRDGTFPIMRRLLMCYDRDRAAAHVKTFVEYCSAWVLHVEE